MMEEPRARESAPILIHDVIRYGKMTERWSVHHESALCWKKPLRYIPRHKLTA